MSPSENLLKEALITNRKSQIAEQAVSVPMTLSDLERRDVGSIFFPMDLPNYARAFAL